MLDSQIPLGSDIAVYRGDNTPAHPEISVVVMAIDGDARAAEAIASLDTHSVAAEIIVVNTGTGSLRDALAEWLERIVLVEGPTRRLPGGTRNLGIAVSSAPIVTFLASDCLATPGWLAARLAAHRQAEAVASAILPAPGKRGTVPLVSWATHLLLYWRRDPDCPPGETVRYGVSYSQGVFTRQGRFLEDRLVGEDTDFNGRLPERPIWEPSIVTLHRNPTRLGEAMADAWRRGVRLRPWMSSGEPRPTYKSVLWCYGAARNARMQLRAIPQPRRDRLMAALPLVWLLTLVRIVGVLSQVAHRP